MDVNFAQGRYSNLPAETYPGTVYFITDKKAIFYDDRDGNRIDYLRTYEDKVLKLGSDAIPAGRILEWIDELVEPVVNYEHDIALIWVAPGANRFREQLFVHKLGEKVIVGLAEGEFGTPSWKITTVIWTTGPGLVTHKVRLTHGIVSHPYVVGGPSNYNLFRIGSVMRVLNESAMTIDEVKYFLTDYILLLDKNHGITSGGPGGEVSRIEFATTIDRIDRELVSTNEGLTAVGDATIHVNKELVKVMYNLNDTNEDLYGAEGGFAVRFRLIGSENVNVVRTTRPVVPNGQTEPVDVESVKIEVPYSVPPGGIILMPLAAETPEGWGDVPALEGEAPDGFKYVQRITQPSNKITEPPEPWDPGTPLEPAEIRAWVATSMSNLHNEAGEQYPGLDVTIYLDDPDCSDLKLTGGRVEAVGVTDCEFDLNERAVTFEMPEGDDALQVTVYWEWEDQ